MFKCDSAVNDCVSNLSFYILCDNVPSQDPPKFLSFWNTAEQTYQIKNEISKIAGTLLNHLDEL